MRSRAVLIPVVVDAAADWLLDQVEAVHGQRDLCDVNGWYGDGICDEGCPLDDPDCVDVDSDAGAGGQPAGGGGAGGAGTAAAAEPDETDGCQCAIVALRRRPLGWLIGWAGLALFGLRRARQLAARAS